MSKTILITGASRGIGKAIYKQLKRSEPDANFILTSRNHRKNDIWYAVDFTTQIDKFLSFIRTQKIDILINNAGINITKSTEQLSITEFDTIMKVNLYAPFLLMQAVLPYMKQQQWGRIVNIASILGTVSMPKRSAYSASKAGLIGMTRAVALEVADYNILVNCVSPGITDTDLTRRVLGENGIKEKENLIPLGRLASPNEIANLVAFLVSEQNTYITGQNYIIDGGYTIE